MSGSAMIAFTIAGASHTVVTRERSISSTTAAASNTRWMIVVAPAAMSVVVVRSSAPTWYSGPHARPRSALVKPNSTMCARFFHARLAWVSMTPFGRPVVPDVYMSRCTSSAATAARGPGRRRPDVGQRHPSLGAPVADAHTRTRSRSVPVVSASSASATSVVVAHEGPRLGVVEDVPQLRRREPPVDRHRDRAEVVGREDRLEELGAVVREQADDVAGARHRARAARPRAPRRARPSRRRSRSRRRRSRAACPAYGGAWCSSTATQLRSGCIVGSLIRAGTRRRP